MNRDIYPGQTYPWWQTCVIYQIYPRSFMDTTGNGVGDLMGIIEKLDYLSDTLGVDAIWISPFYPSPMADFGYDVADYVDVHPMFGSLEVFDQLLTEAHQRGLRLIIDFVPNHSSDQHPWFLESRASQDNPKRDWYVWADPKTDGSPPNNWLSVFGGPAWEWDEQSKQYYLHSFLREQPDLNWRNPVVKEAMFDIMRFWLERGVDGFRIDVAHFIMKDPQMRNNPLNQRVEKLFHKSLGEYDSQIHLYDKAHPDVHQVYREMRRLLDSYNGEQPRVSIGEIHIYDLSEWVKYYGEDLDEIHLPFNFQLLKTDWQAKEVQQIVDNLEVHLPPGAWPNYVLGNHDESRLASRLGEPGARLAAMLLLTLRGTPTLYYGDEIGMKDVEIPLEHQQDPWGMRVPGLSRDPCRTPMQWKDAPNAGCSPDSVSGLWLPLAEDYQKTNVENQLQDPTSILSLYRRLLKYRRSHPELQIGKYVPVLNANKDCFVYLREFETNVDMSRMLIALNFSNLEQQLDLSHVNGSGHVVISTRLDRSGLIDLKNLILRTQEGVIVEL